MNNMNRIKIDTLTSVHIGSGDTLQYGSDFINGKSSDDDSDIIGIISPDKVMTLIGTDKDKIDTWVLGIENKRPTIEIVKQYNPKATIEDLSKRTILEWAGTKPTDTLKEFIHDGLGRPYIPGSSIKGAIRTAVLASLAEEIPDRESKSVDRKGKISAKGIEKFTFGNNPNSDIFRFLHVGDASFGNNYEVAIRMVNINEREVNSFWDTSKSQVIEALCPEDSTTFDMKIDLDSYNLAKNKVHILPECLQSLSNLFKTINTHTLNLLQSEIGLWSQKKDMENAEKVDVYINNLEKIETEANHCNESDKSCVLRIGHGAGWRFITGAWSENMDDFFYQKIVPSSRPNNNRYQNYNYPKTRRVDDQCELLGFVKLTIL